MNIILWIVFGALAGWIASVAMKSNSSQGIGMDILMGIAGAFVGGFVMSLFGQEGVSGFNFYSLIVAVLGSILLIWLGRTLRRVTY